MRVWRTLPAFFLIVLSLPLQVFGQSRSSSKPVIIRDTGIADGVENEPPAKERNPAEAEKNIDIGDFYYKKKNYDAAIGRYLTALEYQSDSDRAYKSLEKAYRSFVRTLGSISTPEERDRRIRTTLKAFEDFLELHPDWTKREEFREKLSELEEKLN